MAKITKEALAGALNEARKLRDGHLPTEDDLAGAPVLDDWSVSRLLPESDDDDDHYYLCLVGVVSGHPRLPDGPVRTSCLLVMDPANQWARTIGRYYRLGRKGEGPAAGRREKIVRNSVKCLKCGDEIESRSGHDFKWCSCRNVAVDGGREYGRRVGGADGDPGITWIDTSIVEEVDDGHS